MKKLLVSIIWISMVLVLSSCTVESKFNSEGHQYAPEGAEEKH